MFSSFSLINYDAYEPYISSYTMNMHYNNYKEYLENLNKLLNNYDGQYAKEELVKNINIFPITERDNILFNLGGVLNHELFFKILGNGQISDELNNKIVNDFKSFDNFKQEFIKTANLLTGSGYTFLVLNNENNLEIINVANQDTPYSYGLRPIMNLDLWEHAYYLDYQNDRSTYINNFFSIINFDEVSKIYAQEIQKNL